MLKRPVIEERRNNKLTGVYGGESNGSNPIEWTLRSTILSQLRALGWYCSTDEFSDNSASWIEVYKEDPKEKKQGKLSSFIIEFNDKGQIITNIKFFEQQVYVKISEATQLF